MVRIILITVIYLFFPILIVSAFHKWKPLQKIGTVMMAYTVGIILSLTGMVQFEIGSAEADAFGQVQTWIMNLAVPIAIPLMLFNCDFKLWTKSLPKTFGTLIGGLASVLIAVISAFFIFRNSGIENFHNVAGMMTGIYTGGTMNFFALGSALKVDPNVIMFIYTFEMVVTFPLILFITAGGYRFFRKILPYKDSSIFQSKNGSANGMEENGVEDYRRMLHRKVFPKTMCGLGLSLLFLAIGAGLSLLLTGKLNELVIIMTITTLAIASSFSEKVRNLPKTFELGMIFILVFSIVVASQFNIQNIQASAFILLYFVLYVMLVSVLLHLLFCRFGKISGDLFTVAHVGLLCSPPFIPPVVGAMGNRKVLISGIVIGLVGYAVGTYLGIGVAFLLNLF
ncbi:MAG: DUF819 family protein [Bacteroidales bacterium]|nr:DUF819 family protein [Bacteroidales bacterium]